MKYFLILLLAIFLNPSCKASENLYSPEDYEIFNLNSERYILVSVKKLTKLPSIIFFLIGDKHSGEVGAWITSSDNFYSYPMDDAYIKFLILSSSSLTYDAAKIIFPDYILSSEKYGLINLSQQYKIH